MTKKGLLTKSERTALEKLLADSQFKGKDQLKFLIWLNSTNPKFKKGDCFKVSDRNRKFFGVPAVNVNGRIINIFTFKTEEVYHYELEVFVLNKDGRETTSSMFATEEELKIKAMNHRNAIVGNGKYTDSLEFYV